MPKYFNATFGPLVWNDEGQIIGGGEWLDTDPTPQIEKYLVTQEMVLVEEPEKEKKPTRTRRSKQTEETQE